MSGFGQVALADVFRMLERCAPGYTATLTDHYYCIKFGTLTYPNFPKGEHAKRNPPIQFGHVRKLARHFGILPCAMETLRG